MKQKISARKAVDELLSKRRFRWPEALPWVAAILFYFFLPQYIPLGTQILVMVLFALSLDLILG
jgi:branched-chain amino acid transport system permease protein